MGIDACKRSRFEKSEIDAFLKRLGPTRVYVIKTITMGYGKSGAGDYALCLDGVFWNVEVKRPGKEPTPIQYRRMKEVREAGGRAIAGTAEVVIAELTRWLAARGIAV